MERVEQTVTQIQGLSGSKDDWEALHAQLENVNAEWPSESVEAILSHLNPAVHTVGYVHFLLIRAKAFGQEAADEGFLQNTRSLLLLGHAGQLSHTRIQVQEICETFTVACRARGKALFGVKPLKVAVEKVRPSPEHLTTIHHNLLQLCLIAKVFKPAEEIIEGRVVRVNKEGMQARDVLLYLYYGGMVFAALKRFQRAFDTLQLAFAMPCHALNEIVVEIYKKYVLVSLIVYGNIVQLPKYTTPLLQRMLKSSCGAYHEVATAFASLKMEDVRAALEKHKTALQADNNWGLANQALASIYTRNIQRLTHTFVTLSLKDIAVEVDLPDANAAKTKILEMMDKAQIVATLDQEKGMASFNSLNMGAGELLEKLTEQIGFANELNTKLRDVDETISCNAAYLNKVAMQERQSRWGESADWAAAGASTDEMMDMGEKPPGFSASLGAR
mmetsp:Transcript_2598/g.6352  ORF Transcript_2598/g.6352 Transcript_2598/m.6352 type:complete len:445 (+) Transcript_2598:209-1543(+)